VEIGGQAQPLPTLVRRAPGVWFFTVQAKPGQGGSAITLGATFDGQPIVVSKSVPIATDIWSAEYATTAAGGCALAPLPLSPRAPKQSGPWWIVAACAACAALLRRARRRASPARFVTRESSRSDA
jgi:hypothetical protein